MTVTYLESVMTLVATQPNYDEMTKEEFAEKCVNILEEDGYYKDPEVLNG